MLELFGLVFIGCIHMLELLNFVSLMLGDVRCGWLEPCGEAIGLAWNFEWLCSRRSLSNSMWGRIALSDGNILVCRSPRSSIFKDRRILGFECCQN